MAVTFVESKNYYSANFNGRQYTYSVNKYGPLAEMIANKSFETKTKIYNYIENRQDYSVMKIFHMPSNNIYDVLIDTDVVSWQEDGKQRSKKFNINKLDNALEEAISFRREKEIEHGYL